MEIPFGSLKLRHEACKCDCCVGPALCGVLSSPDLFKKK